MKNQAELTDQLANTREQLREANERYESSRNEIERYAAVNA